MSIEAIEKEFLTKQDTRSVGFIISPTWDLFLIYKPVVASENSLHMLAHNVIKAQVGLLAGAPVIGAGFFWQQVPMEARLRPDSDVILHIEMSRTVHTRTRATSSETWEDVTPKLRIPYPPFLYQQVKGVA